MPAYTDSGHYPTVNPIGIAPLRFDVSADRIDMDQDGADRRFSPRYVVVIVVLFSREENRADHQISTASR